MNLVNLDGLTIGPGSEWFWSAASGIVLGVTFVALYRQLRVQAAAAALAQIEAMMAPSEKWSRHALVLMQAFKENPTVRTPLPEGASAWVGNYFERQATLARKGFINVDLLFYSYSSSWQSWWWLLEPDVRMSRARAADPRILENVEWLAGRARAFDLRQGQSRRRRSSFSDRSIDGRCGWRNRSGSTSNCDPRSCRNDHDPTPVTASIRNPSHRWPSRLRSLDSGKV